MEPQYSHAHYWPESPSNGDLVFIYTQNGEIILPKDQELLTWEAIQKTKIKNIKIKNINIKDFKPYCFAQSLERRYLLIYNEKIINCLIQSNLFRLESAKAFWRAHAKTSIGMLSARAGHIAYWRDNHQFCGVCGLKMQDDQKELARVCSPCGKLVYPRISPCIIVLIYSKNKILLGRSPHFPKGRYSSLAGFIEPGETVEQAVHREVKEEVGIKIKNLNYITSQPWPFPDSLMIGFMAEYDSGEIQIDPVEIEDARWFSIEEGLKLSSPNSIARMLIERFQLEKLE